MDAWICRAIFLRAGSPWRGLCWGRGPRRGRPSQGSSGLQPGAGWARWWHRAACQSRMSGGVPRLPGAESPRGRAPRHGEEGLGRLGWGHFGAVETCGAGGRASTLSAVARQMGDTPALPSLLAGGSGGASGAGTQPWGSWGWGGWRRGPTLTPRLFSPIAPLAFQWQMIVSTAAPCLSVCLSAVCRSWPRRFLSCVAARALPTPSSSS